MIAVAMAMMNEVGFHESMDFFVKGLDLAHPSADKLNSSPMRKSGSADPRESFTLKGRCDGSIFVLLNIT